MRGATETGGANDGSWICDPRYVKRMLVVAPHADDETFGMGGTIAKAREAGITVRVALLTGDAGRVAAFRRCADLLGFEAIIGLPDLRSGEATVLDEREAASAVPELADRLAALIRAEKPDMVLRPHPREMHAVHRAAAEATAYAVWRASRVHPERGAAHRVRCTLAYESTGHFESASFLVYLEPKFFKAKIDAATAAYAAEVARSPDYLLRCVHNGLLRGLQLARPETTSARADLPDLLARNDALPAAEAFFV